MPDLHLSPVAPRPGDLVAGSEDRRFSRLDFRIQGARIVLEDGRGFPATKFEEELFAMVLEARWLLANAEQPTGFAALEPHRSEWARRRRVLLEAIARPGEREEPI